MKRQLIQLAFFVIICLSLNVTAKAERLLEFGPKVGLGFVTMRGDEANELSLASGEDPGYLVRGHFGAFVAVGLNERLSIQTEIAYVQRGAKWEKTSSRNDTTNTAMQEVGIEYIEIPVLLKLTLPNSTRFQPYLSAGSAIAFRMKSETTVELEAFLRDTKVDHVSIYADKITNAKSTVLAFVLAAGVEYKIGSGKLLLEGRYTGSFGETFDDFPNLQAVPDDEAVIVNQPSGQALEAQHSAISVLVGYGFGFNL